MIYDPVGKLAEAERALAAFVAATEAGYTLEHRPGQVRLSHPLFGDGESVTGWIDHADLVDIMEADGHD